MDIRNHAWLEAGYRHWMNLLCAAVPLIGSVTGG